jgi:hypothetical protein
MPLLIRQGLENREHKGLIIRNGHISARTSFRAVLRTTHTRSAVVATRRLRYLEVVEQAQPYEKRA